MHATYCSAPCKRREPNLPCRLVDGLMKLRGPITKSDVISLRCLDKREGGRATEKDGNDCGSSFNPRSHDEPAAS